jgi:TrmH family RNA methyltransferase
VITSRENAKVVLARKLLRQAKHREETGLFACEGEDLLAAAGLAGIEPVELLVADDNVAPALLASISTLPHPARVVGVFRRADLPSRGRDVTLGLWQLADPGNVGTLIRTADAFGAGVALSHGCADPLSPKALRASAGAIFRVPLGGWDALPERRVALVAHGGEPLAQANLEPPVAFLLGSERDGLPDDLATDCCKVTVSLTGGAESLNVAAAGAIALYELRRR